MNSPCRSHRWRCERPHRAATAASSTSAGGVLMQHAFGDLDIKPPVLGCPGLISDLQELASRNPDTATALARCSRRSRNWRQPGGTCHALQSCCSAVEPPSHPPAAQGPLIRAAAGTGWASPGRPRRTAPAQQCLGAPLCTAGMRVDLGLVVKFELLPLSSANRRRCSSARRPTLCVRAAAIEVHMLLSGGTRVAQRCFRVLQQ